MKLNSEMTLKILCNQQMVMASQAPPPDGFCRESGRMSRAARPGQVGKSFLQGVDMGRDLPHGKSFLAEMLLAMKILLYPQKISGNFLLFSLRAGYSSFHGLKLPKKIIRGVLIRKKRVRKAELVPWALWLVLCEICQDFIPSEAPVELRFPRGSG